jgi:hypothetical protein
VRRWAAGLGLLVLLLAACGAPSDSTPDGLAIPPDGAPPDVVLQAYLEAVRAGNCATARHFVIAATFRTGTGELCGALRLHAWRLTGQPLTPSPTEMLLGMTLTTDGTPDGSIPAGDFLWTYDLVRQSSGAWRIVGAGQG